MAAPSGPPQAGRPARLAAARPALIRALLVTLVFGCALWPRLNVRERMVTADEDTWLGLTGNFAAALLDGRPERTYQIGHPGVTALWSSLAGLGPERARRYAGLVVYGDRVSLRRDTAGQPDFLADLRAARHGHAVVNSLLVTALAALTWRLLGARVGLLCGLLLALDPFLVAHAQVIRMDSLQAGFLGLGLLAVLVRWAAGGARSYLLAAGLAFGLALLSKTSSLFVGLPIALCAAWHARSLCRGGHTPRRAAAELLVDLALLAAAAGGAALAGLPALWRAPLQTVARIVDYSVWNGSLPPESGNFFLGQPVPDPGPAFYPLVLAYRLTPLVLGGLIALAVFALRRPTAVPRGAVLAWLGLTVLLFLLAVTPAPKKADRYLLPVWPLLLLLAAVGLELLLRVGRRPLAGAAGALLAAQLLWLPPIAPYALLYFNPLLGGPTAALQQVPVGWGEGLELAASAINAQPDGPSAGVATLYSEPLQANLRGQSLPLRRFAEADYLVDYVNMEQRDLLPPEVDDWVESHPPLDRVEVVGLTLASIYALPKPEFGKELRVDRLRLDRELAGPGERLRVNLRWTPLEPGAAGWRPRLELLDQANRRLVAADPPGDPSGGSGARHVELQLRLPATRQKLTLALSVLDANGAAQRPSQVPPWARLDGRRLIFPSITVRIR